MLSTPLTAFLELEHSIDSCLLLSSGNCMLFKHEVVGAKTENSNVVVQYLMDELDEHKDDFLSLAVNS
jgi:hypothetical protein